MKTKALWALAALNVLLLGSLALQWTRPNTALAQVGGRSDYLMIPGDVIGGSNAVVYVIDENKQELSAISLNNAGTGLDAMQPISLARIFEAAAPVPAGGGRGR